MSPLEILRSAMSGVIANKMRSLLTMLGLVIGVASVILLIAMGNGATNFITGQLEGLGANTIYVMPGLERIDGPSSRSKDLTLDDTRALQAKEAAPDIARVAPVVMTSAPITNGPRSQAGQILATTPEYLTITDNKLAQGMAFTAQDEVGGRKVAVLGHSVAKKLFPDGGATGQRVMIGGSPFQITGVVKEKGLSMGDNTDSQIFIPLNAARQNLVRSQSLNLIIVQAKDKDSVTAALRQTRQILKSRHQISKDADADFTTQSSAALKEQVSSVTGIMTGLLAGIASISLLVAGIGITNIMLVSVTERTREIGIRKAIGASRSAILGQFLAEATFLSVGGGLLGVMIGVGCSQFSIGTFKPSVTLSSVLLSFSVAVAIGLFFGIFPANRAASMRPIDALRYE